MQLACSLVTMHVYADDSKQETFVRAELASRVDGANAIQSAACLIHHAVGLSGAGRSDFAFLQCE